MARKKSVRKSSKKNLKMKVNNKKFNFVLKRLLFFGIMFFLSFALYYFSSNEYVESVFGFLSIIFGFLGIAFLIVFLIFVFMKSFRK